MPVAYPFALRTFLRDTKSRSQPAAFRIAEPRRGFGYVEPTGTDTPVFWDITHCFTRTEAAQFRLWFTQSLLNGTLTFTIPVDTEFGLQTYELQYLPDSLLPARQQGEMFTYTATVMARAELIPAAALTDYAADDTVTVPAQYLIVGVAYSLSLSTYWPAGTGPFTWSVVGGTLPAGVTLNSATGVLSGTPLFAANFADVVLRRTGAYGASKDSNEVDFLVQTQDARFADVLFLLNGQSTVTKDSGPSNRTLTTVTTAPTLDATVPLFGFPTYKTPTAADGYVGIASDTFINAACSNQEWCVEGFVNIAGSGVTGTFASFGRFVLGRSSAGVLSVSCTSIASSSYTISSSSGALPAGTWMHFAFVRDKTGATFDFLKLYLGGVLVATSSSISKSAIVDTGSGFGRLIGYNAAGSYGNFSNLRMTAGANGDARYYSAFTPPSAPFATA